jgi:hypothetical protein
LRDRKPSIVAVQAEGIQQACRVFGHVANTEGFVRKRSLPDASVVESDHSIVRSERGNHPGPIGVIAGESGDQQQRRASSRLIEDLDFVGLDPWHCISEFPSSRAMMAYFREALVSTACRNQSSGGLSPLGGSFRGATR